MRTYSYAYKRTKDGMIHTGTMAASCLDDVLSAIENVMPDKGGWRIIYIIEITP